MTRCKLLAAIPLLIPLLLGAATLPPDLAKTVRDYDLAQTHNDVTTLSRLVADDFTLVNSNGTVEDKREFLADFHLRGFKILPYVIQQKIDRAWGDGAVTGGLLHLEWFQGGSHHSRLLRVAYVWRKRAGHWQAVYAQVTRAE